MTLRRNSMFSPCFPLSRMIVSPGSSGAPETFRRTGPRIIRHQWLPAVNGAGKIIMSHDVLPNG